MYHESLVLHSPSNTFQKIKYSKNKVWRFKFEAKSKQKFFILCNPFFFGIKASNLFSSLYTTKLVRQFNSKKKMAERITLKSNLLPCWVVQCINRYIINNLYNTTNWQSTKILATVLSIWMLQVIQELHAIKKYFFSVHN